MSEPIQPSSNELIPPTEAHRAFFVKHAIGPLARPSCLVCGHVPEEWPPGIQHAELPGIIVCTRCREAGQRSVQGPAMTDRLLTSEQNTLDEIGRLADLCDNMVAAAALPVENTIAVRAMTAKYQEVRDRLRAVYLKLSGGENPWE